MLFGNQLKKLRNLEVSCLKWGTLRQYALYILFIKAFFYQVLLLPHAAYTCFGNMVLAFLEKYFGLKH